MFVDGDTVKHLKSGNYYKILEVPDNNKRLEYCNEPYYTYRELGDTDSIIWLRRKSEFEDGRFEFGIICD